MRKQRRYTDPLVIVEQAKAYGVIPPDIESAERWLSPNDAAKVLNITGEAIKQWIYKRKLPAVKLANGYWKINVKNFETFLAQRLVVTKPSIAIRDFQETPSGIQEIVSELDYRVVSGDNDIDFLLKAAQQHPSLLLIILPEHPDAVWPMLERICAVKPLRGVPMLWFSRS